MIAQVMMFSNLFGGRRDENQNPLLMLAAILIAPIVQLLYERSRAKACLFELRQKNARGEAI